MTDDTATVEAATEADVEGPAIAAGLRSAGVYAIGGALPRAIGLITLPVYTHFVAPAQYGAFSLLVTISTAVTLLFTLGLDIAVMRIYFQLAESARRQEQFVNSVWAVLIVVPLTAAIVLGAVAWPLVPAHARFDGLELFLALLSSATSAAATTVPLAVLRAEQRLRAFLILTSFATIATSGLSLLFVVGFGWGIRGWLGAVVVANVLIFGVAAVVVPLQRGLGIDFGLIRYSLKFGAPLVPHSLAYWALQVADRVVIAGMVSASALGVYSLAANLGLPVLILVQSLNYGFMPAYARAGAGLTSRQELEPVVVLQATVVTLICAACALLAPPFAEMVTPGSYGHAGPLVPWIALGYGFLGLYAIPMNGVSLGAGRATFAFIATGGAAATNIALLFLLVPYGGIRAAAISAAAAYAVLLVAIYVYAHRPTNPVQYRWKKLVAIFAVFGLAYVAGRLTSSDSGGLTSLAVRVAWLVGATLAAFADRSSFGRLRALA